MKTAAAYLRCSTDVQTDTSIPDQMHEIETWASAHDYEIVEWFKDGGKSGVTYQQRPDFLRLITTVERCPAFKFIFIYDRSRWGRPQDSAMNEYWEMHCQLHGVKLISLDDPDLTLKPSDLSTRVKKMLKDEEASEYSKKLSRATLRGCKSNAEKGFSSGGFPPYGYKRVAVHKTTGKHRDLKRYFDDRDSKWKGERNIQKEESVLWQLADEQQVKTVQRIFELKVMGVGFQKIAKMLNAEGAVPPNQNPRRIGPPAWGGSTVRSILLNRTYLGERIYNRIPNSPFKKTELGRRPLNKREDWVVVPNAHPAIITQELFDEANKFFKPTGKPRNQALAESPYLLTGLIFCSHCGYPLTGAKWKSGNVKLPHYIDHAYLAKGKSVCAYYGIKKTVVESAALKAIQDVLIEGNAVSLLQSFIVESKTRSNELANDESTLIKMQKEIQTKIDNLIQAVESGIKLDTVVPRIHELEKEKQRISAELDRIRKYKTMDNDDIKEVSSRISKMILEFQTTFDALPILQKKHLIRRFVHRIVIDREKGKVIGYIRKIPKLEHPLIDALYASESPFIAMCAPNEIRTRVPGLKSPCPRPLDDRGGELQIANFRFQIEKTV